MEPFLHFAAEVANPFGPVPGIVQFFILLFGIAGFAGGAVGYFAKGRADAVIALSAKEIQLLKDANTRLEKENVGTIAERDRLKIENDRLAEIAKGSKLEPLAQDMRDNTKEVRSLIKELRNLNGNGKVK